MLPSPWAARSATRGRARQSAAASAAAGTAGEAAAGGAEAALAAVASWQLLRSGATNSGAVKGKSRMDRIHSRTLPGRGAESLLASLNVRTSVSTTDADDNTPVTTRDITPREDADLPDVDPEFDADEWCRCLRMTVVRAEADKHSVRVSELEKGTTLKIVEARPMPDQQVRLQCEDDRGQVLGWISCYDGKGDPLLENVDSDSAPKVVPVSPARAHAEPDADAAAAMAARFKARGQSKQKARWGLVKASMSSLTAFKNILEPDNAAPALGVSRDSGRDRVSTAELMPLETIQTGVECSEMVAAAEAAPNVSLGGPPPSGGGGSPPFSGTPPKELRDAVRKGGLDAVRRYVQNGDYANSVSSKKLGSTLLYAAAQNGHLDIVEHLIANGADVNKRTLKGATPLYTSAYNGDTAVVDTLLRAGALPHLEKDDGWTAMRAAEHQGHARIVQLLEQWSPGAYPVPDAPMLGSPRNDQTLRGSDLSEIGSPAFNLSPVHRPMSPQKQREAYYQQQEAEEQEVQQPRRASPREQHEAYMLKKQQTEQLLAGGGCDNCGEFGHSSGDCPRDDASDTTQEAFGSDVLAEQGSVRLAQLDEMRSHMAAAAAISAQLADSTEGASTVNMSMQPSFGGSFNDRSAMMPARRPRRVQEVTSHDIRVGSSVISMSSDLIMRGHLAISPTISAPVDDSILPGGVGQLEDLEVSVNNIRSWDSPTKPARSPWNKERERELEGKRRKLVVVAPQAPEGELRVWEENDPKRRDAKKRWLAKEVDACVADFTADLFSPMVPSTPLSEGHYLRQGDCKDLCGKEFETDDVVHSHGFLSDWVLTKSETLTSTQPRKPDTPPKAKRSVMAADAEVTCQEKWASGVDSDLNRSRAERGVTMHPILGWDEHGAETETQLVAREKAEEAEKRRVWAERAAEQAEMQKLAEQEAAAEAEAEAAHLRAEEADAARKAADAAAIAAEASLVATRQRRELEAARSAMVVAEALEDKLSKQREQAVVTHSQLAHAAELARTADERAQDELNTSPRRRAAWTPGARVHGALSTHLTARDLSDAETIQPHLQAHVQHMAAWQSEMQGETEQAVLPNRAPTRTLNDDETMLLSGNFPQQSPAPPGVGGEVERRVNLPFDAHKLLESPYVEYSQPVPEPVASPRRVVVTVEVPPETEVDETLFNDPHKFGVRVVHMHDEVDQQGIPEGLPPVVTGLGFLTPPATPQPQQRERSPGGVSYYTQPTPPRKPFAQEDLPPPSPTAALNAYQRR